MSAIGNLNDYVKYQMAQGHGEGRQRRRRRRHGAGGRLAIAQQMMKQPGRLRPARRRPPGAPAPPVRRRRRSRPGSPELLDAGRRGQGARRHRGRRHGEHRVRRPQGARRSAAPSGSRGPRSTSSSPIAPTALVRSPVPPRPTAPRQARLPGLRGDGATGTPRSRRWSARSAAPSRRPSSPRDGSVIKEHDLVAALREQSRTTKRGWETRARLGPVPELPGDLAVRAGRVAQNCEFCGSPQIIAATSAVTDADRARERAALRGRRDAGARGPAALVRQPLVRAEPAEDRARSPTGARPLHALLDLRRPGRSALDGRGRPLLLRDRDGAGTRREQVRKVRWEPASGALDHFFDDELVPATQGVAGDCCARSSRSRPQPLVPVRPRLPVGLGRRAVPDRPRRRRAGARDQRWTRSSAQLCAAQVPGDTQRNLQVDADYSRADLQARPRAAVDRSPTTTARGRSRCWSTA